MLAYSDPKMLNPTAGGGTKKKKKQLIRKSRTEKGNFFFYRIGALAFIKKKKGVSFFFFLLLLLFSAEGEHTRIKEAIVFSSVQLKQRLIGVTFRDKEKSHLLAPYLMIPTELCFNGHCKQQLHDPLKKKKKLRTANARAQHVLQKTGIPVVVVVFFFFGV